MPLFWVYIVLELAVFIALVSTIGLGWTALIVIATFVIGLTVGVIVTGSQLDKKMRQIRAGLMTPEGVVSDGALLLLGVLLVIIPGLVTSAVGLFLLLPPSRAVLRPVVAFLALRAVGPAAPLITVVTAGARRYSGQRRGDYVDGEVVDVSDTQQLALPPPEPEQR